MWGMGSAVHRQEELEGGRCIGRDLSECTCSKWRGKLCCGGAVRLLPAFLLLILACDRRCFFSICVSGSCTIFQHPRSFLDKGLVKERDNINNREMVPLTLLDFLDFIIQ